MPVVKGSNGVSCQGVVRALASYNESVFAPGAADRHLQGVQVKRPHAVGEERPLLLLLPRKHRGEGVVCWVGISKREGAPRLSQSCCLCPALLSTGHHRCLAEQVPPVARAIIAFEHQNIIDSASATVPQQQAVRAVTPASWRPMVPLACANGEQPCVPARKGQRLCSPLSGPHQLHQQCQQQPMLACS